MEGARSTVRGLKDRDLLETYDTFGRGHGAVKYVKEALSRHLATRK
jgi:hypothetical protein